ncbi:MAG TPA: hypothetical protein PKA47_17780 [Accumulibacter sp.]|jgi:hypothetical protein|uniref:hypothetical protein n=1 Tax=Accumulibacter sp. TaxID=2053492 RepID=UPI002B90617D|nr:hypothetical protein [Accumulibacter sp.]HMW57440.1 hypothetical protein [Accumulibacter sp.]HNE34621.1 hypothetical protein [Nitrospira sp.]
MAVFENSNQAAAFWWRIANDKLTPEMMETLREVAYTIAWDVFETQYDPAEKRTRAALKAVGFNGRRYKYPGLKEKATAPDRGNLSDRDIAWLVGATEQNLPDDFDEKKAAKSAERFQKRARAKKKS